MTLDVCGRLISPDLDDVAERLNEVARQAGGVSCVCPDEGAEAIDKADEDVDDDDDDRSSGAPARVR